LRGLAILSVTAFHMLGVAFAADHPGFRDYLLDLHSVRRAWWFFTPLSFGWTGVALFFVISGYVIHRGYLLSSNHSWLDFLKRRFWRIYPAYFLFLVIFALAGGVPFFSSDFILHALMMQNLTDNTFFGSINGVFWSIAVECQLYAMYPLAIIARNLWGWKAMLPLSWIIALPVLAITYHFAGLSPANPAAWHSPLLLWPTWLIGAAIAENHARNRPLFSAPLLWISALSLMLILSLVLQPFRPLGFYFAAFSWAAVLDTYVLGKTKIGVVERPIAFIGMISYSIYIIHVPLMLPMSALRNYDHPFLLMIVGLAVTIPVVTLLGWLSYLWIEKTGIRFGKALASRRVLGQ
jgi:peptidoglycan/LPS O-acetylase OafA/YrhL